MSLVFHSTYSRHVQDHSHIRGVTCLIWTPKDPYSCTVIQSTFLSPVHYVAIRDCKMPSWSPGRLFTQICLIKQCICVKEGKGVPRDFVICVWFFYLNCISLPYSEVVKLMWYIPKWLWTSFQPNSPCRFQK